MVLLSFMNTTHHYCNHLHHQRMPCTRPFQLLAALSGLASLASAAPCSSALPIVDLGYERHQALALDEETDTYFFQNIRYAQAPTSDLRFRAPQPPLENRHTVQNGSELRVCPQGIPEWQFKASSAAARFADPSVEFSLDAWVKFIGDAKVPAGLDVNVGTSEDCLFLDVRVPKSVFEARRDKSRAASPVLVWIHGGGGILGAKGGFPEQYMVPSGILSRASEASDEGLIFVALNYRLGAFGYLDSPDVRDDGNANTAYLDQRLALQWVQDNIHLFGGDRSRVTAMGESGGGGSIILQMAADSEVFGPTPFSSAIIQSPAYIPTGQVHDGVYDDFLGHVGVRDLAGARAVDEQTVIRANEKQISEAPASTYTFGNTIDGVFTKSSPMQLLRDGRFNKSVSVLVGHNAWEGSFFFDADVRNDVDFAGWIARSVAGLRTEQIDELVTRMYPAVFDGTLGYASQVERQMSLWGEGFFDCSVQLLSKAMGGRSYAYQFSVPPAFHTQDLRYTFNAPGGKVPFPDAQAELQAAIVSFAQTGVPRTADLAQFPHWGSQGALINITAAGVVGAVDRVNETRCAWWADV